MEEDHRMYVKRIRIAMLLFPYVDDILLPGNNLRHIVSKTQVGMLEESKSWLSSIFRWNGMG